VWLQKVNCFFVRQLETKIAKTNDLLILNTSNSLASANINSAQDKKLTSLTRQDIPSLLAESSMLQTATDA